MGPVNPPVAGSGGCHSVLACPPGKSEESNAAPHNRDPIIDPSTLVEGHPDGMDEMVPTLLVPQSEVNTSGKKRRVLSKSLHPMSVMQAAVARVFKKLAGTGIRRHVSQGAHWPDTVEHTIESDLNNRRTTTEILDDPGKLCTRLREIPRGLYPPPTGKEEGGRTGQAGARKSEKGSTTFYLGTIYGADPVCDDVNATLPLELHVITFGSHYYMTSQGRKKVKQVEEEITRLKSVHHPNVVRVLAVKLKAPHSSGALQLVILSEQSPALSLRDVLDDCDSLRDDRVSDYIAQILSGLNAIHVCDLVHRGISATSIGLVSGNCPSQSKLIKLTKVGYHTRLLDLHRSNAFGYVNPPEDHVMPEAWLSKDAKNESLLLYTHHRDIHAVGVILLQMLLGLDVTERFSDVHTALRSSVSGSPEFNYFRGPMFRQASCRKEDWEELELLGKGAFGSVIKARDRIDNHVYAVKKVRLRTLRSDTKTFREVNTLSRLSHRFIVRYYTTWVETAEPTSTAASDESRSESDSSSHSNGTENGMTSVPSRIQLREPSGPIIFNMDDLDDLGGTLRGSFPSIHFTGLSEPQEDMDSDNETPFGGLFRKAGEENSEGLGTMTPPLIVQRTLYIQMEFVERQTLKEQVDEGIPESEANCGRSGAHIYRDIKLANIFIDTKGNCKVGNFGLATSSLTAVDPSDVSSRVVAQETDMTLEVSTHLYIAPEVQSRRRRPTNHTKADMYSLGIVFFEMNYSFTTGSERISVIKALRRPEIVFPDSWDALRLPQREIITWLLQHEPEDRPTALELSQSPLLPSRLEDEYFKGALKMMTKPDSPHHQAVLASLFKQSQAPRPVRSFLYDHEAELPEHASLNGMVQDHLTAIFRYDNLITKFSPPKTTAEPIHAIGLQIAIDKITAAVASFQSSSVKSLLKEPKSFGYWSPRQCDVYVISYHPGYLQDRLELASYLWRHNISADVMYESDITNVETSVTDTCKREGILFTVNPKPKREQSTGIKVNAIFGNYNDEDSKWFQVTCPRLRLTALTVLIPRQELVAHLQEAIAAQKHADSATSGATMFFEGKNLLANKETTTLDLQAVLPAETVKKGL
ncbi:kinase-like domain-containing protein [Armillaria novae-zelandiae]|uniref:Kinase-like domain-containing protein n=1 Tax=Armillaria novae-zelandiae TaxID=153914 RepID=A0AA39P6J7_9AGAR|nr:kinase-like domain-containing protein [Armillaria novae-zelandiae]